MQRLALALILAASNAGAAIRVPVSVSPVSNLDLDQITIDLKAAGHDVKSIDCSDAFRGCDVNLPASSTASPRELALIFSAAKTRPQKAADAANLLGELGTLEAKLDVKAITHDELLRLVKICLMLAGVSKEKQP